MFDLTAFAGAPQLPDDYWDKYCKGKPQLECIETVNPKLDDKKLEPKSPKKKVSSNPYLFAVGLVSNYAISQSEYAQELEEMYWDKVNEIDQGLDVALCSVGICSMEDLINIPYEAYNELSDAFKTAFPQTLTNLNDVKDINADSILYPQTNAAINHFENFGTVGNTLYSVSHVRYFVSSKNQPFLSVALSGINNGMDYIYRGWIYTIQTNNSVTFSQSVHGNLNNDTLDSLNKKLIEKFNSLSHTEVSPETWHALANIPMPNILDETSVAMPEHVPNLNSDHFPSLPDKTLYNPNDYSIVHVDGKPYIEIDFVPKPDPSGNPVPEPTTPYLVPYDDPNGEPIPIFPDMIPVPDPAPNEPQEPETDLPEPDIEITGWPEWLKWLLAPIINILKSIWELLKSIWDWLLNFLNLLKNMLEALLAPFLSILQSIFSFLGGLITALGTLIGGLLAPIINLLQSIFEFINGLIQSLVSVLEALFIALFVPASFSLTVEPIKIAFLDKFPAIPMITGYFDAFSLDGTCTTLDNITVSFFGKTATIVDFTFLTNVSRWTKPVMSGFIWLLVVIYTFKKITAGIADNHGSV